MRHGKIDATQAEVVAALRRAGAFVASLADLGRGVPDLLVGYRGRWYVMECKTGKGKTTQAEDRWMSAVGNCAPVHTVRDAETALRVVGAM